MGFIHADSSRGLHSYPAVNSFSAISAEAGIASKDAPTAYDENAALVNIYNKGLAARGGTRVIVPRKLEMIVRAANTTASDFRFHFFRDNIDRWASGGTQLTPYQLSDSDDPDFVHQDTEATIYVGELVTANAGSTERVLWRTNATNVIFTTGDKVTIIWGGDIEIPVAPDPEFFMVHVPPMWIGPGKNLSIHEVATAQAADPKFQFNFWYDEVETT